jgi:HEAT repeat protein
LSRTILLASLLFLSVACGGGGEVKKNTGPKKNLEDQVSPADLDDVNNHIGHLSNSNRRERWRNGLIDLAGKGKTVNKKIIELLVKEYKEARAGTSRALNEGGRERSVYVLAKIGDGNAAAGEIIKSALTDPNPGVRVTAAEKFAEMKDGSILPDLLKASAKPDPGTIERVVKVLMLFASTENRDLYLDAVTFDNLSHMIAVVDKTIASDERKAVLSTILSSHQRPASVAYAVMAVTNDKDGAALGRIQAAKKRLGDSQLNVVVYDAHERFAKLPTPPAGILDFYLQEIRSETGNPQVAAEKAAALNTVEAIKGLAEVAVDTDAPEKSRIAIFKILVKMADRMKSSDSSFKAKKDAALVALRAGIGMAGEIQKFAAIGLGSFAEASDANRLDRALGDSDAVKNCGREIIIAMAALSGDRALGRLLGRLKSLQELRKLIGEALTKKKLKEWTKSNLYTLVDYLREPDVGLRRSAHDLLCAVTGESIRFDPAGDAKERKLAAGKWAQHIRTL